MLAWFGQFFRDGMRVAVVVLLFNAVAYGQPKIVEKDGDPRPTSAANEVNEASGFFIPIPGAKDGVYDHLRERFYVTTLTQLVVIDVKERQILEAIDLLGNLQGIDIAPQAEFLVIAPIGAQFVYKLKLDWKTIEDMEITRIRFSAPGSEPGVFSIGVGADGSALFGATYSGSGWVKLRRLNPDDTIEDVARVRMNSVIAVSGDRQKAYIGEGNISSGPLLLYKFDEKTLTNVIDLSCFHYALACSANGSRLARPNNAGCDLYDERGTKLGTLSGAAVIAAAYNPVSDALYVMRHGERSIQEYSYEGQPLKNSYPLDKALVIKGDVHSSVIANVHPVGGDMVMANVRRSTNFFPAAYKSGRLRVSEDGQSLCVVVPDGGYIFDIQDVQPRETTPKPRVKIIDK